MLYTCIYMLVCIFMQKIYIYNLFLGTIPATPENITVTFLTPSTVRVSWQTMIDLNAHPVEKYIVTYKPTDDRYVQLHYQQIYKKFKNTHKNEKEKHAHIHKCILNLNVFFYVLPDNMCTLIYLNHQILLFNLIVFIHLFIFNSCY